MPQSKTVMVDENDEIVHPEGLQVPVVFKNQSLLGTQGIGSCVMNIGVGVWSGYPSNAEPTGQIGIQTGINEITIQGIFKTTGLTVASKYYVGLNQLPTDTPPSGSGEFVVPIGFALDAETLVINTTQTYIELA